MLEKILIQIKINIFMLFLKFVKKKKIIIRLTNI